MVKYALVKNTNCCYTFKLKEMISKNRVALRGEYCQKIRKSRIDIIALNDRSTTREVRFQVSVQLKAPL